MASAVALGSYNVAYKPTNLIVSFGATVAAALFPVMVQPQQRGEAPASFRNVSRLLAVSAPAMALSGLAVPLVLVLYGEAYRGAAPILSLLAWSAAAHWLYAPLSLTLQARGRERLWLAGSAAALMLNLGGNLWAIPRFGALGAAGATVASELALLVVGLALVGWQFGILPPPRAVLVGLVATAAAGAVLWFLRDAGAVPATMVALAVYGAPVVGFRVFTSEDAAMVIGWIRQAVPGWSRA